ncbi:zinc-dependent metalloprotease [Emticicia aquatilis]|nr:zinc-dependent metalloprotease [Emticicia aquatilis]
MLKVFSTLVLLFITSITFSQESKVPLCGTPDSQILDAKVLERMRNAGKNPNLRMADLPMLECLVAVAVEYDIYLNYNKNQDLIKGKVYEYFEKVSKVYEDEMEIKLTVNHIEIITTNRSDTLQRGKKKLGYHIAHLFKLYDAVPNFAAGIAFISKTSDGQYDLYCISGNFNVKQQVLKTMAHEIGHCFDSPHTHNCNWPNGPIDICYSAEGGCLNDGVMNVIGSIMSYCQNNVMSFHPFCREVIRNRADEILPFIITSPNKPIIESLEQKSVSTQPYLAWKFNLKTIKYQLQVSDNQTFIKPIIDSTLYSNFFQAYSLENNKSYYWRVKSINQKGTSDWSETAKITCDGLQTALIPIIKGAFLDKENIDNVSLEVYPVIGASTYEFRLTDYYNYSQYGFDRTRLNNTVTFRVNSPKFTFNELQRNDFYNPLFYWQARIIKDGNEGEWTSIQTFNKISPISHIFPKQSSKQGTSFPIIWQFGSANVNREYTLEVAEDEDFKRIHTQRTRVLNKMGESGDILSGLGYEIIENLKTNTVYYYRYKEKDGVNSWVVSYFKTGSSNSKWKFINPVNQPFVGETQYFTQNNDSSKVLFINKTGIYQTDGINWEKVLNPLTTKGLINPDYFTKIKTDLQNNIYFNQPKVGFVEYDGNNLFPLSSSLPFSRKTAFDFVIDKNKVIYITVATDSSYFNIYKYSQGQWSRLPNISKIQNLGPVLYIDKNNNLWATIADEGIFKFNGKSWENIISNTKSYIYGSFTFDSKGNIWWVDIKNNYYNINRRAPDNSLKSYLALPSNGDLPLANYKNLISDRKGNMWLLADINQKVVLFKLQDEKWVRVDVENDLPLPLRFLSDYSGMTVDKQNRLWIFTNSFGAYIYDDSGQVKSQTINAEKILNQRNTTKPFKIIANASSNLPLSYKLVSGPAKIKKDSITLTGEVGKVTLQISQPGNEIYEPAKNVELSFEVTAKATQTISFAKIEQKTLAEKSFTLTATTTSGLPITYQIVSGPAIVSSNVVTLTGTGKVTIKAKQEGNAEFLAANEVMQEFCVIPAKPIISADASNNWILEVNADKNLQWYFNGTKVENGTKSTLLVTQNGQYKVEVFNSDATCASNTSDTFQLLILANEDDKSQTIKVFPNPADDWVTVDSENSLKINSVKLYDLKGSLLYTNEKSELPHKIKIHSSWQGNVLLEIKTNDKTYLKKLVLN